jgi:signal transduction histidine kinase
MQRAPTPRQGREVRPTRAPPRGAGSGAATTASATQPITRALRTPSAARPHDRERFPWALHDEVIRSLFAISMNLESARTLLRHDPARVDERLAAAVDGIDATIHALRNHDARGSGAPTGLSQGLVELAIEHEITTLVHASVDMPADLESRVPPALVPDLLRIVREALASCAGHTGASRVEITGQDDAGFVGLWVHDDAAGCTPGAESVGRGLHDSSDRSDPLHGGLEIHSAPGEGTRVRITAALAGPDPSCPTDG